MDDRDGRDGQRSVDMPKGPEMDRLPPPAFPPGVRRVARSAPLRGDLAGQDQSAESGFPAGALISPDEPIRRIGEGFPDGAFISPDDPIEHGGERPAEGAAQTEGAEEDDVEVTGMGTRDPDRYRDLASHSPGPRTPEEVAAALEELAGGLRTQGSAALASPHNASPFDSGLRGFVGGYLVGREP